MSADLAAPGRDTASPRLILLLAVACGTIVANIYYAQPLIGPIAASLHLSAPAAGLIVTLTQLGYVAGLLLVVPAADLVENRRLVLAILALATAALLAAALSHTAPPFLAACLCIGLGSVAVQVLVPYAADLTPPEQRGQVVGLVMSGLMCGIMLGRPLASVVADAFGWHAVFALSAVLMVIVATVLRLLMPQRRPASSLGYAAMLASMASLAAHTAVLQRRAAYQACLFGTLSLFWTVTPLFLAHRFGISQSGIALFTLVAAVSTFAAPIAGRLADRGYTRPATLCAITGTALALALALLAGRLSHGAIVPLVIAASLLDFCVTGNLVLGQRAIYALSADIRGRLNGIYMASAFLGGAVTSAIGAWAYATGGWPLACACGVALPLLALALFLTETKPRLIAQPAAISRK